MNGLQKIMRKILPFQFKNRKLQTATEYLILIAVVIIIALIVISVLGGIPSIGGGAGSSATEARLKSQGIGVENYAFTNETGIITLKNNKPDLVSVTAIYVDGKECGYGSFALRAGQTRKINCSNITNSGSTYEYSVSMNWTDIESGAKYVQSDSDLKIAGAIVTGLNTNVGSVGSSGGSGSTPLYSGPYALSFGNTSTDYGYAVDIDSSGNTYVGGFFSGYVDFGNGVNVTSLGGQDAFILKLNSGGEAVWVRSYGSSGTERVLDLVLDGSGNAYATGVFANSVNFSYPTNLTSAGGSDVFVVKVDSSGNTQWVKGFGNTGGDEAYSVSFFGSDVMITGYAYGNVDFSDGVTYNVPAYCYALRADDVTGSSIYLEAFNSSTACAFRGAETLSDGVTVVYSGYYMGTMNVSTSTLTSEGNTDIFVAMVTYSGGGLTTPSYVFNRSYGNTSNDWPNFVSVDSSDNAYIGGYFRNDIDFGDSVSLSGSTTSNDAVLFSVNSTGHTQWARNFSSSVSNDAHEVDFDSSGNSYVAVEFGGNVDFGGGYSVNSPSSKKSAIVKLNSAGVTQNMTLFNSSSDLRAYSVALDSSDRVYLTGYFQGDGYFNSTTNLTASGSDIFLVRYE